MDQDRLPEKSVVVGRVLGPRGVRGELQIEVISDSPGRFSSGGILFINNQIYNIQRSSTLPKGRLTLKLDGIDGREQAQALKDSFLTVTEDLVPPLPEGQYYHFQIIDMQVYTQEGEHLGQITDILSTGSNDVYVVSLRGTELLIPALDDVIKEVDVEQAKMVVALPDGLRPSG